MDDSHSIKQETLWDEGQPLKLCGRCKTVKPHSEFGRQKDNRHRKKVYLRSVCRSCDVELAKEWVEQNRDKSNAIKKRWTRKNPEKVALGSKKYAEENPDKIKANGARWIKKNPGKYALNTKAANLRKLGVSPDQYAKMLAEQGGVCAICKCPETNVYPRTGKKWVLSVDHDHATEKIRGLLCSKCNTALGFLRDSSEFARSATEYLDFHRGKQ